MGIPIPRMNAELEVHDSIFRRDAEELPRFAAGDSSAALSRRFREHLAHSVC
jgi:hypothetical protein